MINSAPRKFCLLLDFFLLLLYCILAPLLAKDEPVTVISASFPDALQVPSNDLKYYKTSQRNKAL